MTCRILIDGRRTGYSRFVGYNRRKEGYEVHTAANGCEAVEKALATLPHLIILDVMMPEMDGMETCRQIRSYPQFSHTVIAFLTARSDDFLQISGFEAGGDDYITKPVKVNVLVSRTKALL